MRCFTDALGYMSIKKSIAKTLLLSLTVIYGHAVGQVALETSVHCLRDLLEEAASIRLTAFFKNRWR